MKRTVAPPPKANAPPRVRVGVRRMVAELLGLTDRQLRDFLALHPGVRQYRHPRSSIVLVSIEDIEALVEGATPKTTLPLRGELLTVDDVLASVGLRRKRKGD